MSATPTSKTHLIIAPHHDDAEFGCGGIMARYGKQERFAVLVLFSGDYMRADRTWVRDAERYGESMRALAGLNVDVNGTPHTDFVVDPSTKENEGNVANLSEMAAAIERMIEWVKPTDLYTCLPGFNQDHRATHEATRIALRPVGSKHIPDRVWAYEYPGDVHGPIPTVLPTTGVRHTRLSMDDVNAKEAALREHRSQFKGRDAGLISPYGAVALARWRGVQAQTDYAETHYLLQEIVP